MRFEALPGDAPAEFHERLRAEPLHFRPQRVHGLAHPFAFVGCAGQPDACRIVELRSLALAEQPQSLAAKRLSRVDPLVQLLRPRRGRIQAMPAVPQERLDPAAGLLVIRAQPVHPFRGRRLGFRGPRLDRPADGFGQLVAPQRLRPLDQPRRPRHAAGVDPQSLRLRLVASGRFAEPLPLVEPEALRDPPERGRDPPDEARGLLHPASGLLERRALGQPRRMLRQLGYRQPALLGRPFEEGVPVAVRLSLLHEGELVAPPFHNPGVPLPHLVDEGLHLRRQIQAGRERLHAGHDPGVALHPVELGSLGFGPRHEGAPVVPQVTQHPARRIRRLGRQVRLTHRLPRGQPRAVVVLQRLLQGLAVVGHQHEAVPRPARLDVEPRLSGQPAVSGIQHADRRVPCHSLRRVNGRAPGVVDMTELRVVAGKRQRLSAAEVEAHPAGVDPEHHRLPSVEEVVPLVVPGPADPVARPDPDARRLVDPETVAHPAVARPDADRAPRGVIEEDEPVLGACDPAGVPFVHPERRHPRVEDHEVARLVVADVRPLGRRQVPVHVAFDLELASMQHSFTGEPLAHHAVDLGTDEVGGREGSVAKSGYLVTCLCDLPRGVEA